MRLIENQNIPGRSRRRLFDINRDISRSESPHDTFDRDRGKSGARAVPVTVQTVLYNNKPTNIVIENDTIQPELVDDRINSRQDIFTQSESLISSGIILSHNPYQYATENHKMPPHIQRNKARQKQKRFQKEHLNLNYENEDREDSCIEDNSPLEVSTKRIDEPNGRQRFHKYPNTDNSFRGTQSNESEPINNMHSVPLLGSENRTNATTPSSIIVSAASKIYNRMSQLFNSETTSLYSLSRVSSCHTLKGNEHPNDKIIVEENGQDEVIRTGSLNYESELDDEGTDLDRECEPGNFSLTNVKYNTDKWTNASASINNKHSAAANKIKYKETLQEINDFQNNFVKKYNNIPTPVEDPGQKNTSRTLQKVLDYKDLYSEEEGSSNFRSNGNLSSKWHPLNPGNTSYDYRIKIQHEALISEYTQIKLRFSSSLTGSSAETYSVPNEKIPSQFQMKSKAGVLGFIDRSRYFNMQGIQGTEHNNSALDEYKTDNLDDNHFIKVNSENKEEYISKLWQREVDRMFPIPDTVSPATTYTQTSNLEHPRKMSIDLRSEDYDIYQNSTDRSHIAAKSIDLSQMARNVRFKRYA